MRPAEHFVKFFRQLPGLSYKVLTLEEWEDLLSVEDRIDFRSRVEEYFPTLTDAEKDRMAQFLYDKNQELLRESGEQEEEEGGLEGNKP
ncbi:MAG: hypothetical protein DMH00_02695 [Acidobacteria bacterium]|nr:MAG: hypothetical protein DMH00_02695 [Acidobacteriota bacterium]